MQSIIPENIVKKLLPQKYPFVMVRDLLQYEEEEVITQFPIEARNIFLKNNFLNESGMLENVAQSIALHTSYGYYLRGEKAPIGYIGSIKNVHLLGFPKKGEWIKTHVKIIKEFMGVTMVEGQITQNKQTLMTVNMKTFIATHS